MNATRGRDGAGRIDLLLATVSARAGRLPHKQHLAADGGWRDAPKKCGPPKTLCNRWRGTGIFARIMAGLAAETATPKTVMIDATDPKRPACGRKRASPATSGAV
jgi:hypothetical protein